MLSFATILSAILPILAIAGLVIAGFLLYVWIRYAPIVARILREKPVFQPLRAAVIDEGEEVRFPATDGLELVGTYLRARTDERAGVVLFCHEYLGDRWSVGPYADHLRDLGFDLFTFDFRNHGESGTDATYEPLQWVSDVELKDLHGALRYLRTRPDRDPAGVGLFGVSRGGGTALCVAADDPTVWGVVSDGAFPTRGTMLVYILRWAEIYVGSGLFWRCLPTIAFRYVGWAGRTRLQRSLGRRYANMERAVSRLSPRPWLAIHGERDAYIGPAIARGLFAHAGEPKSLWIVPGAKHNRCRDVGPELYAERVEAFFRDYAPRRPAAVGVADSDERRADDSALSATVAAAVH